jgi:hypothetical protein
MKAIAIQQPWAQLLVAGAKQYHVCRWRPRCRGPLLIQSTGIFAAAGRKLCAREPFASVLGGLGITKDADLPLGMILGQVTLEDCQPTDRVLFEGLEARQLAFGDFLPGHFAWKLSEPNRFVQPIPYLGAPGIFEVPEDCLGRVLN